MITLNNITMGFTQRTLFKNVSLSIFRNEKIGLTGPNGSGKTTLFSLILGDMEPVQGNVQIKKNTNIGYLPQESKFHSQRTIMEELTEGDNRIKSLLKEKKNLEDHNKADTQRYGDILEELEQLGIYEIENRAERILTGLGFKQTDFHRPISDLSGGWQMRTLLAKLLTYPFDLLLMDEPTNFLDLEATIWLKNFLNNYRGSFVLIAHDRVFLNEVTNYTMVLDHQQLFKVKGNYETYEQQKDINLKFLEKKQKVVEKKRKQLERFTQRFHAQPNRAAAVRNKRKMIERLERIELPQDKKSISSFDISQTQASGYVVAQLEKICKSYGDQNVYHNLNLEITRGQKICLVGPNGAGKSTLLKMLARVLEPDSGNLKYGHQVEQGYFSQTRLDVLNPSKSAFDEVISSGEKGTPAQMVRNLLGLFNFRGDDVFKNVKVLSGGEKSRLILAKLLIKPPNFILLDEPTTHLDLDGVKALTNAFRKYDGTLCFISHNLYFIQEVADCIIDIHPESISVYPGGLSYYLDKKSQKEKAVGESQNKKGSDSHQQSNLKKDTVKENKKSPAVEQLHQLHKKALKRISEIKNKIKNLEKEKEDLETESYVKSRILLKSLQNKDSERIKEYGLRMKVIQKRLRAIETEFKQLKEERKKISK